MGSPLSIVVLLEYVLSVLFGTAGAKKNIFAAHIKRRFWNFAPAGATKGSALGARRLLKKAGENFHE